MPDRPRGAPIFTGRTIDRVGVDRLDLVGYMLRHGLSGAERG